MATFHFELNSKPNKNKLYSVFLRITNNKKHKRMKTDIYLKSPNDFNVYGDKNNWVRRSEPFHKKYNDILQQILRDAEDEYRELNNKNQASLENVINKLKKEDEYISFIKFAEDRKNQIYDEGGYRNSKNYGVLITKINDFIKQKNKSDLLISELDTKFLYDFEAYLHTLKSSNKKDDSKLHPNYIAKLFNTLKAILNLYYTTNRLNPNNNPFVGFKKIKTIPTQKVKLELSDIKKIEDLDLPKDSLIWNSRNVFLMSYYCGGIRLGDVLQLRWENIKGDNRLEYTMSKNDKIKSINIHSKMKNLLSLYHNDEIEIADYIFPFLDSEADYAQANTPEKVQTMPIELQKKLLDKINTEDSLINKYLAKVKKQAGINQKFTMHIARHSFAKQAANNDINNNVIKNLLSHSSLAITEKYIGNFKTEEEDNAMEQIFNPISEPKKELKNLIEFMPEDEVKKLLNNIKKEQAN